jgi:hypothetical protein
MNKSTSESAIVTLGVDTMLHEDLLVERADAHVEVAQLRRQRHERHAQLDGAGARGEADPTDLCKSLCTAVEERRGRCGGDLRGGEPSLNAFCAGEERDAAE